MTWHQLVPRDLKKNLLYRQQVNARSLHSKALRQDILNVCRQDILFWINTFVFQFNPNSIGRNSLKTGPFITWKFQDEALLEMLDCVKDRKDLVIEKSREMGASWLCLLLIDWMFLFKPWYKFLVISRSAVAVDDPGNSDSLFWKLDFIHEHLPDWMAGPNIKRRKMGFSHTKNRSAITGEASTGKAGVGGRADVMFIDEMSQIEEDYEVLQRTSDTTGCRIFNGTHLGTDTAFFQLTDPATVVGSFVRKLQLHWTQHPDKVRGLYRSDRETGKHELIDRNYPHSPVYPFVTNGEPSGGPFPGVRSPWYDDQCHRKGSSRAVAMDLDIDPAGSVNQFFDRQLICHLQTAYCCDPYWQGNLDYDKETGQPRELVKDVNGILRLWLRLDSNNQIPPGYYTMGADLCDGSGATNSCLSIANGQTGEKVGELTTPFMNGPQMAPLAVALCRMFRSKSNDGALFAWEMLGPGIVFGRRVIELGYRNIYYRRDDTKPLINIISDSPGWYPSPVAKRLLLEEYRSALATRKFLNRSQIALEECLKFRYSRNGTPEHGGMASKDDPSGARENHGDRVIADGLTWMLAKNMIEQKVRKEEQTVKVGSLAWRKSLHDNAMRQHEAW